MKQTKSRFLRILVRIILPIFLALAIFFADQYVKTWTELVIKPQGYIPLLPGVFHLNCTYNTGAAWSVLSGQRSLLLGITCIAMFCIAYAACTDFLPYPKYSRWAMACILGGALGNFYDRLFRPDGGVVDMFDFCLINFPVFNVADIFICIGGGVVVLCLALDFIKSSREFKKEQAQEKYEISEELPFEIEENKSEDERHDS